MTGPTLQLNITAPGQKSVEGSVFLVKSLAEALRDLPKASEELLRLQKALQGVNNAPSGLKNNGSDLKELVGEIKNLSAQLGTSFGSLEETIKAGWGKAAKAQAEGEAKVKAASASKQGASVMSTGTAGQPVEVPLAWLAKMQTGSQKIEAAREAARRADYTGWWEAQIAQQETAAAKFEAAYQKSITKLESLVAKQMKAAEMPAYKPAGPAWWEAQIAQQETAAAKLEAAYQKSITKLESLVAKQMKAAEMPAYKPAGPAWWEAQIAAQEKADAALAAADERHRQQAMARMEAEAKTLRVAEEQREAALAKADAAYRKQVMEEAEKTARAEREAQEFLEAQRLALQRRNAAYASASPGQQARTVLNARAQLSEGVPEAEVRASFGTQAAHAAQITTLEKAYAAVHGEMDRGGPKFKSLTAAMNEAHSAARGLASGFGAMYLTWGSIAPLLAGAALSQSFVQSVKLGANVRQDLETLRVLSNESQQAVDGLERQLISLGERGPFGPREVAEAMKTLSLAGLSAQEVGQALKPALDLAVAGGTTINKASEELVAIGTAYGYLPGQFATVSDAITKAAAISMSSVEGMSASFRTASVIAQQYKVSLDDTATGLALLANIGIRGSSAGVALRQMYSELSGATSSTRKEMEKLGVKVIDTNTGAMKPMVEIIRSLNTALASKSPEAFQRSIQNLSNERGAKATVALLEAYVTKAKELGASGAANELERLAAAIQDSAGFSAISAAQLVATPLNQMKAVVSTFETALFKAFKDIEPTILVVSKQLKDAFNSDQFSGLVTGLASAVANATVYLVEHGAQIKLILEGYILWKGAVIGLGVMNTVIAAGTALWRLYGVAAAGAAAASAAVSETAGLTAIGTATTWATGGFRGMAAAAGVARASTLFLGPIAALIGIAATAWTLYEVAGSKASVKEAEAAAIRNNLTLKSLDDEIERLKAVQEELSNTADAREASGLAEEKQAQIQRMMKFDAARAPFEAAVADAQSRVAKAEDPQGRRGGAYSEEVKARARANLAAAKAELDKFYADSAESERQRAEKEFELKWRTRAVANAKPPTDRKFGTDGLPADPSKLTLDSKDLSNLQKAMKDQEAEAKAAYDHQQQLLDIKHKGMLLSDAAYSVESERLAKERYDAEIQGLTTFLADSAKLMKDLGSDPKRRPQLDAVRQNVAETARKAGLAMAAEKEKHDAQLAASQNLQGVQLEQDMTKLRESVDLQIAQVEVARKYAQMLPEEIAAEQALNATRAEGSKALVKLEAAYKQAQEEAAIYMQAGEEDQTKLNALLANELRLRGMLEGAQQRINAEAAKSGEAAKSKYLVDNAPAWQKFVEQGQNSILVLKKYRDEFMQGWVDQGRSIWEEFFKTGKLHLSSLKDLVIKTLADMTYQRLIAKPFSQMGEKLFDNLIGPAASTKIDGSGSKEQGLQTLNNAATALSDSLGRLGTSFWDMFLEAARGLAVMLQSSGSNTGASLGSWLSGLAGKGSGDGTTPSPDIAGSAAASARGSWHDGSVYAFGRGGAFVNHPTLFAFGRGGSKLGIMGEAGPEAVVPLAKTSSGKLGVEVAGGGGAWGGFKQSIIVEDHSGGQPAEVRQESGPNGEQLTRIIVGTVAKDITRGGATRQATNKARNLPRY